jgi:hypothetical protein
LPHDVIFGFLEMAAINLGELTFSLFDKSVGLICNLFQLRQRQLLLLRYFVKEA